MKTAPKTITTEMAFDSVAPERFACGPLSAAQKAANAEREAQSARLVLVATALKALLAEGHKGES